MNFFDNSFDNQNGTKSNPLFASGLNNGPSVLNSSVKIRMGFLRKVYGILSIQLGLTAMISLAIMFMPELQGFLMKNPSVMIFNFLANLGCMFALYYKRNEYPTNFFCLGAFTLFNSLSLGIIISQYDLMLVTQAFFLTTFIVVGLTLYTLNSKTDFTWLGGILSSLLLVSIVGGFFHLFFGGNGTETLLTLVGAFIFSAYIIYDTQLVMKHLSAEEYIVAVINLYLDIINLFIKILRLLDQLKRSEERSKERKRRN